MEKTFEMFKKNSEEIFGPRGRKTDYDTELKYIGHTILIMYEVIISTVYSDEVQDGEMFPWAKDFRNELDNLTATEIRKAIKYLSMDFFAYIYQNNSNKKKFEQLKEPFLKKFRFTFREKKKFQKNLTLFNTGFNSHLILKTLHFPPREDNLYMLNLLDQLKEIQFELMKDSLLGMLQDDGQV